jgi:hypothetical protein
MPPVPAVASFETFHGLPKQRLTVNNVQKNDLQAHETLNQLGIQYSLYIQTRMQLSHYLVKKLMMPLVLNANDFRMETGKNDEHAKRRGSRQTV